MLSRCLLFSAISSLTLQVATTPLSVRADACDRQTEAGTCNSYEECREKGVCYWRKLQTTLHSDRPVDRSDGKTLFDQYYRAEYDITQEADLELQSGFADRGMKYDHVDLWDTLPRGGPPSRFPAYANEFDTANGVIIAQANFKRFDPHKKLEWSELMYQTWPQAQMKADELRRKDIASKVDPPHPPGSPIANLRAIVQHSAFPRGTRAVITAAYNANKDKGYSIGRGDETWRKWTEAEARDFFYALVGTDSVKSTIWLLKDHAAEFGKKTIVAIWTKWPGLSPDLWIDIAPANIATPAVASS